MTTTPPPPVPANSHYETKDGQHRPAWHETNVLIEARVWVGGRLFTARDAVDPFHWQMRFDGYPDAIENYLRWFITRYFGQIAVADEEGYRHFRERLWVVLPTDRHDFRRCHDSEHDFEMTMWPRCLSGHILREWPEPSPIPGAGPTIPKAAVLGLCPCRCHRSCPPWPLSGVGMFGEHQLDEKGDPVR